MSSKTIACCSLVDEESIETFLLRNFPISAAKIKKSSDKKKLLKKVFVNSELDIPIDLINIGKINPEFTGSEMEIIFENDDFLVLNKLPGIHSVPLEYSDTLNCLSFLIQKEKWSVLNTNKDKMERGLLHRLDLGTSGILIFAKNDTVYTDIRKNFHTLTKEKNYFAVVENRFSQNGIHTHYLQPHLTRGKKMKIVAKSELKAVMEATLIDYNEAENLSLVKLKLVTGVRHQLRAQLSTLLHPILGDELYGGKPRDRIYLHAFEYSLCYQQNLFNWTAPLPPAFKNLFKKI